MASTASVRLWPLAIALATAPLAASAADSKTIVIAYGQEPTTLDPCDFESNPGLVSKGNVVQTLTDLDPRTADVVPLLATSWEKVDGRTWIFNLRDGVTYSDGHVFDGEAAAFGINRGMNTPEIACSDQAKVAEKLKVTVLAPNRIKIETDRDSPSLPRELAFLHLPSPATPAKQKTAIPIGTGAYTFVAWVHGQSIELKRRSTYWGKMPEVEGVKVLFRTEPLVRAQMVLTGEADLTYPVPEQLATNDDRTHEFSLSSVFYLRLPTNKPQFTDKRVREAVGLAIDKASLVKALLGRTAVPTESIVASTVNAYMPDRKPTPYDPAKAKQLLAAAKADGVPVGASIDFIAMVNQFTSSDEVVQSIEQNLQDVGLNVKLQIVDAAAWAKILFHPFPPNQKPKPTILSVKNRNSTGDGSLTFTSYLDSKGCCSATTDAKLDALINTARQTSDPAARTAAFRAASEYEADNDISLIPIAELQGLALVSRRITFQPNGQNEGMQLKLDDIHIN
jgi:peptide/nickel transport system substrate-binding protein